MGPLVTYLLDRVRNCPWLMERGGGGWSSVRSGRKASLNPGWFVRTNQWSVDSNGGFRVEKIPEQIWSEFRRMIGVRHTSEAQIEDS
ncbi:hypothetical protein TNCT_15571 [Trichonephila clavata]|uniref:Uncharacterized protein n=1 Tax=Trichonephila clavata TaxID=2740835 RepID=A0A8X6G3G9_TRICU|nr:hypothetical protein TNCT_15571 [Trichonephila clavata]